MSTASFPGGETNHIKWIIYPTQYESKPEKNAVKKCIVAIDQELIWDQSLKSGPPWQSIWAYYCTSHIFSRWILVLLELGLLYSTFSPSLSFPLLHILHPSLRAACGVKLALEGPMKEELESAVLKSCVCLAQAMWSSQDHASSLALGFYLRFLEDFHPSTFLCASLLPLEWKGLGARLCLPLTKAFHGRWGSGATCSPWSQQRQQECAASSRARLQRLQHSASLWCQFLLFLWSYLMRLFMHKINFCRLLLAFTTKGFT